MEKCLSMIPGNVLLGNTLIRVQNILVLNILFFSESIFLPFSENLNGNCSTLSLFRKFESSKSWHCVGKIKGVHILNIRHCEQREPKFGMLIFLVQLYKRWYSTFTAIKFSHSV